VSHSFHHTTTGIAITDTTLRIIKLAHHKHRRVPSVHASVPVPEGAVKHGEIIDANAIVALLTRVARQYKLRDVCMVVPSSCVLMTTIVLEPQVPVAPAVSAHLEKKKIDQKTHVVEYRVRSTRGRGVIVDIHALPITIAKDYVRIATMARMTVVGLFDASYAAARAVIGKKEPSILVTIEAYRTMVALVVDGVSVQCTETAYGGATVLAQVAKERNVSVQDAQTLLQTVGLDLGDKELFALVSEKADLIVEDVTRTSIMPYQKKSTLAIDEPIDRAYITGAYASVQHMADYLSARLRMPVALGNPWKNCFSFDDYIPEITHDDAQQYATSIGALLCTPSTLNLLPRIQKRLLVRRRITRRTVAIVAVCIVAVLAGFGVSILVQG
jgi:type IV pilus assembly protein PilM